MATRKYVLIGNHKEKGSVSPLRGSLRRSVTLNVAEMKLLAVKVGENIYIYFGKPIARLTSTDDKTFAVRDQDIDT